MEKHSNHMSNAINKKKVTLVRTLMFGCNGILF